MKIKTSVARKAGTFRGKVLLAAVFVLALVAPMSIATAQAAPKAIDYPVVIEGDSCGIWRTPELFRASIRVTRYKSGKRSILVTWTRRNPVRDSRGRVADTRIKRVAINGRWRDASTGSYRYSARSTRHRAYFEWTFRDFNGRTVTRDCSVSAGA